MKTVNILIKAFLAAIFLAGATTKSSAEDILLKVTGDIAGSEEIAFSDSALLELPQIEYATSTIWTDGILTFRGPTLDAVLAAAGAGPGDLELIAANNYRVILPREMIESGAPIIANRIDGNPFSIREKGPLWAIFPYDSDERYQTEEIYALSVWQLVGIRVLAD